MYRALAEEAGGEPITWVTFDRDTLRGTMQGLPSSDDISLPVDVNTVVEFLSR
jgi:small subunit ribosomal protein S4